MWNGRGRINVFMRATSVETPCFSGGRKRSAARAPHASYLIPFSDVLHNRKSKTDLKLYPKWDKYRVAIPIPYPSGEESPRRRASPRLTNDDKALIKRLRKEGKTQKEIADILGVTRACISKFLIRKVNKS